MRKKIFFGSIIVIFIMLFTVITPSLGMLESSGPELEVKILPGPIFPSPTIKVTNNGEASAHNVLIKDVDVKGKILYNNRESKIADVIEPDAYKISSVNSWFFGFGLFNITIYVSCDEGMFISGTTNGLIIGSLILIP